MAVNVAKLFKDSRFNRISDKAKLLYVYLVTNPSLSTVGVLSPNIEVVCLETGCDIEQFRNSCRELINNRFLRMKQVDDILYFITPAHFNTIPKSEASVSRVNKAIELLPDEMVDFLESIGITASTKIRPFVKPSVEEVTEYATSKGYLINGVEFVNYYDDITERYGKKGMWVNSYGKQIKDWKATMRKVWFKPDRKIKSFDNAPKGFETFHFIKDGIIITPDGWKNGLPFSKSFTTDIELKKEFNKSKQDDEKRKRHST